LAKTIKDTDYLVISARVKALETGLLTAERMEQILDAKSGEDAGKLLQEWGYPQLDPRRPEAMDAALSAVREATLADLAEGTPDARYIDLFKVKYDYHNVKALLKAEAVGTAPDRMLMDMGRVSTAELAEAVRSRELDGLPETLAAAVVEAREVLDTGLADMMMFSINPSYDYQHGEYANGSATERMALYRRCEAEGVGISVMKAFAGGQLLDARTSPFGQALTEYQCIQYALDKPGVLTVLPGVRDRADLERVLGFLRAGEAERDYSVISSLTPRDAEGTCVYCNHCQPCPAGLDRAGDALAAEHYRSLSLGADACISCGHCDRRCPFHVSQSARMREIASYFRQA